MKTCSKCQKTLDKSHFYGHAVNADGLQYSCKVCMNAYQRARRARLGTKARVLRKPARDGFKHCSQCRQELPLADFYAHIAMSSGRSSKCKACMKLYAKGRYRASSSSEVPNPQPAAADAPAAR